MSIAIVTDSTADIPTELLNKYHIHVVPNIVIIEGQSMVDGVDISRQEFYELLPTMKSAPTTGTASSGSYEKLYDKLLGDGASHILSIHAASKLSGIFNAASAGAQSFGERISIIDSGQISMGLGFQVLAAAEGAARGEELGRLFDLVQTTRKGVRVIAMLDTLEFVRRSGRVSWARARLGDILRVKPFLEVKDGKVLSLGETRTRRKGTEHLRKLLLNQGIIERLAVLHTNAEANARIFLSSLNLKLDTEPLLVNVTTVIGTHVGPNGLGFATVVK